MVSKGSAISLIILLSLSALPSLAGFDGRMPRYDEGIGSAPSKASMEASTPSPAGKGGDGALLHAKGRDELRPPTPLEVPTTEHLGVDGEFPNPMRTGAVFMYQDQGSRTWLPLPSRSEYDGGEVAPVSFENGSIVEIHGKLFEDVGIGDITYYDDIGVPDAPVNITFGGLPVVTRLITGNSTATIDPFIGTGNGTFQFTLHVNRSAGAHELVLEFKGQDYPEPGVYPSLVYRAIACVNHQIDIRLRVSPDPVTVGDGLTIGGILVDDTGCPVYHVPLQIWFDDQLIGPTAAGVYIDNVEVTGTGFIDDFEGKEVGSWTVYSAYDTWAGVQWEWGSPGSSTGPPPLPASEKMWGTRLDGDYQRDAWSFLVSPSVDLSDEGQYALRFQSWWSLAWEDDSCYVLASSDGGLTWDDDGPIRFTEGKLASGVWRSLECSLSEYIGHEDVRVAFVFHSADRSVDTGGTSAFEYLHEVPPDMEADVHQVVVTFGGDPFFRPAYEENSVVVRRQARVVFEPGHDDKTVYRDMRLVIRAGLMDNTGEPLKAVIQDQPQHYSVTILWEAGPTVGGDPHKRVVAKVVPHPGTGEIVAWFVVEEDEVLGPAKVTLEFSGSEFYTDSTRTEDYHVKAHLYVRVPPRQNRTYHRGQLADLGAELRIVPSESIEDMILGDPVSNEVVEVFWNGQQIAVGGNGSCRIDIEDLLVPSTHPLGDVNVTFEYDGSPFFEPFVQSEDYTIVSDTHIIMLDRTVLKGEWVTIDGTILDDSDEPVPNAAVYILWRRAPEIGRATSDEAGRFSILYYIDYEDRVGNVSVIARFKGNGVYMATEGRATYSIKIGTVLERRDGVYSVRQGDQLMVSGMLHEDWGGFGGVEIHRAVVNLIIDGEVVYTKRTAFDGSVAFTVLIDPGLFQVGPVDLVLAFNGSEHYQMSISESTLFIRSDMLISMVLEVDGRPFDMRGDVAQYGSTIYGRISVMDDDGNPLPDRGISVWYSNDGVPDTERRLVSGSTNGTGVVEFHHPLMDEAGGKVSLVVLSPGLPENARPTYTFRYIVPPAPSAGDIVNVMGDRTVEVGSDLDLRVEVRHGNRWALDRLTFSLVSPPDGMEITPSGEFGWTPTGEQVGQHEVTLWLFDGNRSETTIIVVTVTEAGTAEGWYLPAVGAVLACVSVIFVVRHALLRRRKDAG